MSQLILRLEREIEQTQDRQLRAELMSRKACALARQAEFAQASDLIQFIRSTYGDWTSASTHAWIMIAEGVLSWYSDLSLQALDRITRAQVLCLAVRNTSAIAIVAAWKAHIEFTISDFSGMFRSLQLAIDNLDHKNDEAKLRIAITLCNVCSVSGDWDKVLQWFNLGRKFAHSEGDLSSVEALQYNRAALAGAWARAEHFHGGEDLKSVRAARLELQSAKNFQALLPAGTFVNHLALCDARLLMVEGRFALAIEGFNGARGSKPFLNAQSGESLIDLEIAYCKFMLGDRDGALENLQAVNRESLVEVDLDDLFVATSLLHEMAVLDERFGDAQHLSRSRSELRAAYTASQRELRAGLLEISVDKLVDLAG